MEANLWQGQTKSYHFSHFSQIIASHLKNNVKNSQNDNLIILRRSWIHVGKMPGCRQKRPLFEKFSRSQAIIRSHALMFRARIVLLILVTLNEQIY